MRTLALARSVAPRDGTQLRWAGHEHKAAARSRTLAGVSASPRDADGNDMIPFVYRYGLCTGKLDVRGDDGEL
jgi:hypothetical protein